MKWQYHFLMVGVDRDDHSIEDALNKLGKDGWGTRSGLSSIFPRVRSKAPVGFATSVVLYPLHHTSRNYPPIPPAMVSEQSDVYRTVVCCSEVAAHPRSSKDTTGGCRARKMPIRCAKHLNRLNCGCW